MPRRVLGTAGHIDHGKTALVRALTGVDTDRLQEEKERGITIDLGFAELVDGELRMGVVDVPGHEGFIRNMVAGATGMDLVLLVIAADEGVMPQTREHLQIITLLGVERLVVALTKVDLVEEAWLELARDDVAALLEGGPYADAPVVPTSARTGAGIETLARALFEAATGGREREADDPTRLPVDRVFTVHGTGTVVTGTLRSGRLRVGDRVRIVPGDLEGRVRGLQVHGREVQEATAGERTAVALAGPGLDRHALARGQALVAGPGWEPAAMLTARVRVLPDTGWTLESGQRVRVHLGTAEVMARCAVLERDPLGPGDVGWVQLRLESPVAARARDAFVLRSYSPMTTIAGGRVAEPFAPRRTSLDANTAERLRTLLEEDAAAVGAAVALAGAAGAAKEALPVVTGLPPGTVSAALDRLVAQGARACGGRILAADRVEDARATLLRGIEEHHRDHPLLPGVPAEALRASLPRASPPGLADQLLDALVAEGAVEVRMGSVRRTGFETRLDPGQEAARERLRLIYREAGLSPPTVDELPQALRDDPDLWPLLRLLEAEGALGQVDASLFFWGDALERAVGEVEAQLGGRKGLGPADFREVLPVTRKHLMPLLAYLDARGVTVRRGEGREVPGSGGTRPA